MASTVEGTTERTFVGVGTMVFVTNRRLLDGSSVPNVKRVACLANSRKLSGRCIAGIEFSNGIPGGWIRPISARATEEVSEYERQFEDGSDPRVLDLIDIPLLAHKPRYFQSENWLLDPTYYWVKVGSLTASDLDEQVAGEGPLWINESSTAKGRLDRIALQDAKLLTSSLKLIAVQEVILRVSAPHPDFDSRRRVQARFEYGGDSYGLRVTDPVYERRFLQMPDGEYRLGAGFLTISLGEPFQDFVYKLVAAIVEREPSHVR